MSALVINWAGAILDRWLAFRSSPRPEALSAVAGRVPAVVVTGGSSGIGRAIACRFAAAGAPVLLVARDPSRLAAAAAGIAHGDPGRVATLSLDVTLSDAAQRIESALAARGWYLDTLVNSAATGLAGPFVDEDPKAIDGLVMVNIAALTRLTRHALGGMTARGRGGVINIASLGGYVPGPYQAAYYASKSFVCSLSSALHAELAGTGVRMTVVAPGPVDTGFHAKMGAERSLYRVLLPGMSPERVARAAWAGYRLGRAVVVPGILPRVIAVTVTVLPNWVTLPFVRVLLWRR